MSSPMHVVHFLCFFSKTNKIVMSTTYYYLSYIESKPSIWNFSDCTLNLFQRNIYVSPNCAIYYNWLAQTESD